MTTRVLCIRLGMTQKNGNFLLNYGFCSRAVCGAGSDYEDSADVAYAVDVWDECDFGDCDCGGAFVDSTRFADAGDLSGGGGFGDGDGECGGWFYGDRSDVENV